MARVRVSEVRAEHLLTELLTAQGWDTRRAPNGELLRQHEYKDHDHLRDVFLHRSKVTAIGHGLPEGVLVDRQTFQPLLVIEAKASVADIDNAAKEVTTVYGRALIDAGYSPLAVAVAGTSEDAFEVRVFKWDGKKWRAATYEGNLIGWIPNRIDTDRLRRRETTADLRPSVPTPDVLAARADEINRLLRESNVNDRSRPAVVGACMLALWQSRGQLRKDPEYILGDINQACEQAFWKAQKPDLAKSLHVDEANDKLAIKARRIINILERLNVSVLTAEHDYLGQLYETFFRYAGGNTIGQYFTPRHIASFCAEFVEVTKNDIVLDPACGTGGFLIAAMDRIAREHKLSRSEMVKLVKKRLIGFDDEPITAALCVANMILRGDGSSSVHRGDAFTAPEYPMKSTSVVLMNPPYPHKSTDAPTERFVERALEGLSQGGRFAAIIPLSLLVKSNKTEWRKSILEKNSLEAAIKLPDELFQPYAQPYTVIVVLRKGIPHSAKRPVFFARIENDGFRLKKGVRIPCEGSELSKALSHYRESKSEPGFSGWSKLDEDVSFAPGAYIRLRELPENELDDAVLEVIRGRTAFVAAHAADVVRLNTDNPIDLRKARKIRPLRSEPGTVGAYFDIAYGQKALHNKEALLAGNSLVISSSGMDNGCYGFFDFEAVLEPPFVTVPSTGSIAVAHVQEWPCGVTDDSLVLFPKEGVPHAMLYVAAAAIRNERWRFSYGRKATPARIADFPLPHDKEQIKRIEGYLERAARVENQMLEDAEDALDNNTARTRLGELQKGSTKLISGSELSARLSALSED
ncbi:N-6 DNA methylase [Bradyrhizobium yuanmingense]|uniref:HsdM family class I SAM-dependent methyltransferase n=1 Tax=Bradyrhizobium yuanmingense TaxID=108015 RepID=UPI0023B95871|nr:N-6 DNA methylase [Bradyrhizobium yuanmingense]MDF0523220.1 N-6 DNA methylase [Bradyrhizobium yuanmingense]